MPKKITIELHDWEHTCSDGCCTAYGTEITINGESIYGYTQDTGQILQIVLEKLGYEVEIIETYD